MQASQHSHLSGKGNVATGMTRTHYQNFEATASGSHGGGGAPRRRTRRGAVKAIGRVAADLGM